MPSNASSEVTDTVDDQEEFFQYAYDDEEEEEGNEGNEEEKTKRKPSRRSIKERIRRAEEEEIIQYIQELNQHGTPIQIQLHRVHPKKAPDGTSINGLIETFDEALRVEEIKESYGGGTYDIRYLAPNNKGSWEYLTNKRVKIAGPPLLDNESQGGNGYHQKEDTSTVQKAMEIMASTASEERKSRERAEREAQERVRQYENRRDPSLDIFSKVLETTSQQSAEDRKVLYDYMNRPQDNGMNQLLSKFMDSESTRISQLRAQHESEIRMKDESHREEMRQLHTMYQQQLQWAKESHAREVDSLRSTMQSNERTLDLSYKGQISALERELESARRELEQAKKEVNDLRAKKDKGLVESLTEINQVKEALDTFGGNSNSESNSSAWESVLSRISPVIEGVGARMAGTAAMGAIPDPQDGHEGHVGYAGHEVPSPGPSAPQGPDPSQIPVNRPVQMPDGTIIKRSPDGRVVRLKPKSQQENQGPSQGPSQGSSSAPPNLQLDPGEVQFAVQYMETALENGTDPSTFAAQVRGIIPPNIVAALKTQGVDHFLESMAKLEASSPLQTMHGKQWARKVASALTE